jgi:hypothetical protein
MRADFSRRTILQGLLMSGLGARGAGAGTLPKNQPPAGAPMILDAGRILLDIDVATPDGGSRKALAYFNMGMPRTLLSKALYAELGIDRGAPLRYAAAGGGFEIAASKVEAAQPNYFGLTFDQMFSPRKVDAMLTPSALLDRVVVIDYPGRTLSIQSPGGAAPEGVAVPMSLNPDTGLASVDVRVDGALHPFVIDAGSGYVWMRNSTLEKWLAKAPDWRRARGALGAANYNMLDLTFEAQGTVARVPQLAIWDVKLANVGVFAPPPLLGVAEGLIGEAFWEMFQEWTPGPVVGWLGANVLRNFRLTLDYPNRMSYWRPVSPPSPSLVRAAGEGTLTSRIRDAVANPTHGPSEPGRDGDAHDLDQPGVTLGRRDGKFFISGLVEPARGRPLEGVTVGDELIGVGGLDASGASKEQLLSALHGRPGDIRVLTLKGSGGERRVEAPVLDMS